MKYLKQMHTILTVQHLPEMRDDPYNFVKGRKGGKRAKINGQNLSLPHKDVAKHRE